jgi:hypothetical protein
MSEQYPGGFITKNFPTVSTTSAQGMWTLSQQAGYQKLGTWPVPFTPSSSSYIENLFNTYVYDGGINSIVNGINFSANGGLIWFKFRSGTATETNNELYDTVRGTGNYLVSNSTAAQVFDVSSVNSFNTDGVSVSADPGMNAAGSKYVAWSFRKQAKFFDIVTYTGNQVAGRTVAHNLGSVPGFIACKRTDTADEWFCYHTSLGPSKQILLNSTAGAGTNLNQWNNTAPTSSVFSLGTDSGANGTGGTYIAYLFASDATGFGSLGTDSVVSCGTYNGNGGTGATINLGWQPQWIMLKQSTVAGGSAGYTDAWIIVDTVRGIVYGGDSNYLRANSSAAEDGSTFASVVTLTANGWQVGSQANYSGATYIYVAIRKGPMQTPTVGTSVFSLGTRSGSASVALTNSNILTDLAVTKRYTSAAEYWAWTSRQGGQYTLQSNSTDAVLSGAMASNPWDTMTGAFCAASNGATNTSTLIDYSFKRAPSFMDTVYYSGTSVARTISHNLTVVPELIIVKATNAVANWPVYNTTIGNTQSINFNGNSGPGGGFWSNTTPTSSVFSVDDQGAVNGSGNTYVAHLFATCAGVSKVGSYSGTGSLQTINCAFTTGARLVAIRRITSPGSDWYVWDSARGISSSTDPYLFFSTTGAQVTGSDYVDTTSVGFQVTASASSTVNESGVTYIFLAIA